MATAESVKAKLESLLAQANTTTGKEDSTLTEAIASLVAGFGQGAEIYIEDLLIFAQDMRINDVLSAAPYKLRYKNSMIFLIAGGTVAPSSGSYTLNNFWIVHNDTQIKRSYDQYASGTVAPDEFQHFSKIWEQNGYFSISSEGALSSSYSGTSNLGGPGTVIQVIEIPVNTETWGNLTADDTLWGDGS